MGADAPRVAPSDGKVGVGREAEETREAEECEGAWGEELPARDGEHPGD